MSPLVDASALAGSRDDVTVLDVRWRLGGPPGLDSYRSGHVPGAVFVDLDRDLSGPPGAGGRHPLPSAAAFQASMRAVGVGAGRPVIVYDDGDSVPAARAWWMLRYFGHDDVRVLDGGYRAWTDAGHKISTEESAVVPGDFIARSGGMPVLDASGAALLAGDGVLLDVRTPERYRGETEPVDPVAGHIPGAVNAPIAATANEDGTFKDPRALSALFTAAGLTPPITAAALTPPITAVALTPPTAITPPSAVGVYCGSGVTAARGVLALELASIPAALYVGSWSNWITDPTRPIARDLAFASTQVRDRRGEPRGPRRPPCVGCRVHTGTYAALGGHACPPARISAEIRCNAEEERPYTAALLPQCTNLPRCCGAAGHCGR
jgi:thiosulfate/3-mercaptopyruvate sulfurtransferase